MPYLVMCDFFIFQVFKLQKIAPILHGLSLPEDLEVRGALERVLRLPSVASKRYLTNKVRELFMPSSHY